MPEYLSPGVFIEELPPRLRAIEGVSTSTAGFVGPAQRGPVPGFPLPFTPQPGFVVPLNPAPVLVTSFAEFSRRFGDFMQLPDVNDNAYLAWAVRAFFANGGQRCYIARVVNASATDGSLRISQGELARLARTARAGDGADPLHGGNNNLIYLTSLRGISVGTTLSFLRLVNGSNALASPATVVGSVAAPFLMNPGDSISVQTSSGTFPMTPIAAVQPRLGPATPVSLSVSGQTLTFQVGGATAPTQTMTFTGTNPLTLDQAATQISNAILGVNASVIGAQLSVQTDQRGSGAYLKIVSGTAVSNLGFTIGATATGAGSNVIDLAHVTIDEIRTLFGAFSGFAITDDGFGHLRLATTDVGSTAQLQVIDTVAGTANRLGLTTTPATGGGTPRTVLSYNTASGGVLLDSPIPSTVSLDPAQTYVSMSSYAVTSGGPTFWARSPGSWSGQVSVQVSPSDRSPVSIAAPAVAAATVIQVQSAANFYKGAAIEIDHGTTRSYHEVRDISGNALTLSDSIPFHSIPFHSIPFHSIPFHSIPFHSIPFHSIPFHSIPFPIGAAITTASFARVLEIDVVVSDTTGFGGTEAYKGLSWNHTGNADLKRHYANVINSSSSLVYVNPPASAEDYRLTSQPITSNAFALKLAGGTLGIDGLPALDGDYIGVDNGPGARTGIQSLRDIEDIRIVAVPGRTSNAVHAELIAQCEGLRFRFAVLDGEQNPAGGSVTSILAHRSLYDSSFAAYYSPWVSVLASDGNTTLYLPPSGYLAGIYARVDNARGVWKAPANEVVQGITGLKINFTGGEQDILNPRGVDLIRRFETTGIRVWGGRTVSSDPSLKYVNVRRTLIFLEASIFQGTQWVVFEPNNQDTWARVVNTIDAFLTTQWRAGALFGATKDDAYYVRCDTSTMTADDIQNGRLVCQIGVSIVRPAEFVIFRIEQLTGFANQ